MNRKSKIYLLVLIWAAIILQLFINASINRESKMVEHVMSQGVDNLMEGTVKAYAYYGDEELSQSSKELIVKNLADELSIVSGYEISHKEDGDNETTTLTKKGAQADTTIKVITLASTDEYGEKTYENYILTELTLKGSAGSAADEYKEIISDIYKELGMEANTNVYMCSQVKGQLSDNEIKQETEAFLDNMDANEIETAKFDGVTCVYGYCRNIDEYVYQGNNRVNVNIAFSYDAEQDVTYIHRAVPFVDKSF